MKLKYLAFTHGLYGCPLTDEAIINLLRWAKEKSVDKYGIASHESFLINLFWNAYFDGMKHDRRLRSQQLIMQFVLWNIDIVIDVCIEGSTCMRRSSCEVYVTMKRRSNCKPV